MIVVSDGLGAAGFANAGGSEATTAGAGGVDGTAAGRAAERDAALRAGAADLVAGAGDDLRVVVFFLDALMTMGGY